MRRTFFLLCCLSCLTGTEVARAAATPSGARVGEIEVREGNGGMPCFTVPEREELRYGAPDFRAIEVSDGAAALMWKMHIPKERTFSVSYHMCIPYAGRLAVLPQTPALPLRANRLYEVVISADPPREGAAVRLYRGRFCVSGTDGAWKVNSDSTRCQTVR